MERENSFGEVGGVKVFDVIRDIKVVLWADVLYALYGEISRSPENTFEEEEAIISNWCRENNGTVYAAPRDEFDPYMAAVTARQGDFEVVVIDDLS